MKPLLLVIILFFSIQLFGQSYFSSFDQVKIAYTDEGDGDPVLLLHGFISSGNSWNQTVLKKELLAKGYRVIIPDLRGNGNSGKPQSAEAYMNDAEVKDLIALANHLQLDNYTAIGYSRGSIVLAKLLTQESRIQKAVIGGMGLDFTNPNWSRRMMFADAFSGRVAPNAETSGALDYAKSVGADLKVLGFLQDYQPVTSVEALNKIKAPILIIAGDQDHDNGDPNELQEQLPNSTLKIISGDHNNASKGEAFAKAVMAFLKK
jgi:pimeloyl-ACP methyl ester carboxylesterase